MLCKIRKIVAQLDEIQMESGQPVQLRKRRALDFLC